MDMLMKAAENKDAIDELFTRRTEMPKKEFTEKAKALGAIINNQTTNFAFSRTNMVQTELVCEDNVVDVGWHVRQKEGTRVFRSVYNKAYLEKPTGRLRHFIMTKDGPVKGS